jgi:DNA polymerase/3'-5' exonuclease PolX
VGSRCCDDGGCQGSNAIKQHPRGLIVLTLPSEERPESTRPTRPLDADSDGKADDEGKRDTTGGTVTVTVGRKELLRSLWAACGCDGEEEEDGGPGGGRDADHPSTTTTNNNSNNSNKDPNKNFDVTTTRRRVVVVSSKGKCQDCTRVNAWAVYALSRRMLRFTTTITKATTTTTTTTTTATRHSYHGDDDINSETMAVVGFRSRGNHSLVSWNDKGAEGLHFPREAATSDESDHKQPNNVEEGAPPLHDHGWSQEIPVTPNDRLSLRPKKGDGLLEFRVVVVEDEDGGHYREVTAPIENSAMPLAKTKDEDGESGDQQLQEGTDKTAEVPEEEESNQPASMVEASRSTGDKNGDKQGTVPTTTSTTTTTLATKNTPAIYFLPYGLASSRRSKLAEIVSMLGGDVVDDLFRADIVVINGSVRSLAMVARSLKVSEDPVLDHLRRRDVHCVLPTWADACADSRSLIGPSRVHTWPFLPAPATAGTGGGSSGTTIKGRPTKRRADASHGPNAGTLEAGPAPGGDGAKRPRQWQHRREYAINVQVAEVFKTLSHLHQSMPLLDVDQWKAYCFRIVSGRLLNLDFEVSDDPRTIQRLRSIKGFGKGVVEKIVEFLETGTVQRIAEFHADPQRLALQNLTAIWGVGRVTARELMNQGYRDIADVRQGVDKNKLVLDRNQLVGVECYEDILDRMDRPEVEEIAQIVRTVAEKLFPGIEVSVMGSYRRGKETCGDVDIHLVHPLYEREIPPDALGRIIDALWTTGKIAFHLTFLNGMMTGSSYEDYEDASRHVPRKAWRLTKRVPFTSATSDHSAFYMGCLYSPVHPERRRRVDIKFYPYRERIFATVYFTGNGYFNRSMRLWATRKFNCKLNDHGLFERGDDTKRVMEASEEKDLFDYLKLVYKKPEERDSWDALEPMDEDSADIVELQEMTDSQLRADETNVWVA